MPKQCIFDWLKWYSRSRLRLWRETILNFTLFYLFRMSHRARETHSHSVCLFHSSHLCCAALGFFFNSFRARFNGLSIAFNVCVLCVTHNHSEQTQINTLARWPLLLLVQTVNRVARARGLSAAWLTDIHSDTKLRKTEK